MSWARTAAAFLVGPVLAVAGCGSALTSAPLAPPRSVPPVLSSTPSASAPAPVTTEAAAAPPSLIAPSAPPAPAEYSTPLLDERELARAIRASCEAALASKRPVLVEFSAPWCEDCRVLERLKRAPALASELSHWQLLPINIGDGDEHPGLMRAFQVRAIAKLVVVAPSNCAASIDVWPRGPTRTLDGLRKRAGHADEELSRWLASVREKPGRH
ncbi:MAG TPA: thioredoxin domain-containing protein [Polyangiaceae bacterium]|nr:thioredoxin domain-containing protein [Polyangiaceae bacterium]